MLTLLSSRNWKLTLASLALMTAAGCGTPFRSQTNVLLSAPAVGKRLLVDNQVGDVTLIADAGAKDVKAEVVKAGKGYTSKQADDALAQIEVTLRPAPDSTGDIRAVAKHPNGSSGRGYETKWRITAPPGFEVDVHCDVGNVTIEGFEAPLSVATDVGNINVTAPKGSTTSRVTAKAGVGNIRVADAADGLKAQADVGNVRATAGGEITAVSNVGDVHLRLLPTSGGTIKVVSNVGDAHVELAVGQQGRLQAYADVGSVRLRLDPAMIKQSRERAHLVNADLGESQQPVIDLSADVGNVVVTSYEPGSPPK